VVLRTGNGIRGTDRFLRLALLLIELLQFLHAAKGNPVNDGLPHPHHERWRDDKFTVLVIDFVYGISHRMGALGKQLQMHTLGCQAPKELESTG
jgi:hypothetical protein